MLLKFNCHQHPKKRQQQQQQQQQQEQQFGSYNITLFLERAGVCVLFRQTLMTNKLFVSLSLQLSLASRAQIIWSLQELGSYLPADENQRSFFTEK